MTGAGRPRLKAPPTAPAPSASALSAIARPFHTCREYCRRASSITVQCICRSPTLSPRRVMMLSMRRFGALKTSATTSSRVRSRSFRPSPRVDASSAGADGTDDAADTAELVRWCAGRHMV